MITIAITPDRLETSGNPILVVATSSRQNLDNYLMIGDLYVNGSLNITLRVAENPDNVFLFDLHKHIERELGSDFNPNVGGFMVATNSHATYSVSLGDEWRPTFQFFDNFFLPGSKLGFIGTQSVQPDGFATGSQIIVEQSTPFTFSQYNGLATITAIIATSSPTPQYPGNHWIIETNKTWLGTTPPQGGTISLASFQKTIDRDELIVDGTGVTGPGLFAFRGVNTFLEEIDWDGRDYTAGLSPGGVTASFLTEAPNNWIVGTNSRMWLSTFNPKGSVDPTRFFYVETNKGVFRITNPFQNGGIANKESLLLIGSGPWNIQSTSYSVVSGSLPIFDTNTSEYTVWLEGNSSVQMVSKKTFKLDKSCPKYSDVELVFLDPKGSYIPYRFKLKKRETVQMSRSHWGQHYGRYAPASQTWNYNSWDRGKTDLDNQIVERFTLTTDYLSTTNSEYMIKLLGSTEVYYGINGVYQAVNLTISEVERKTTINDQLVNYVVTFELSQKNSGVR